MKPPRLSDEMVAYLAQGNDYPQPNPAEVALLAREVQQRRAADKPEDILVQAGQQVLEALRARRDKLIAEGRCPHSVYRYDMHDHRPYCSDCGKDITEDLATWID